MQTQNTGHTPDGSRLDSGQSTRAELQTRSRLILAGLALFMLMIGAAGIYWNNKREKAAEDESPASDLQAALTKRPVAPPKPAAVRPAAPRPIPPNPTRVAFDAHVTQLNKQLVSKSPQSVALAVADLKNWLGTDPMQAAMAIGGVPGSHLVKEAKAYDQLLELAALAKTSISQGRITGNIGVETWLTAAEFKDIRVEKNGEVLYASDFSAGADGWKAKAGEWKVVDGAYRLMSEANGASYFGDESWSDYTLTLKARKISGKEGFIIAFGHQGVNRYALNLGGNVNTGHFIQTALSTLGTTFPGSIEPDQWYDIKVELNGPHIRGYLNDQLVQEIGIPEMTPSGLDHYRAVALMEKGQIDESVKQVAINLQSDHANAARTLTDIAKPLADKKQFARSLEVSRMILLAVPDSTATVEAILKQRIGVLNQMKNYAAALAEAKVYFNYASLAHTGDALLVLDQQLALANPKGNAAKELFHKEQETGALPPASETDIVNSSVLAAIKVDGAAYEAKAKTLPSNDISALIERGALLLLAGKADEAMDCFNQASGTARAAGERQMAEAWLVRAIKARDGNIGRANAFAAEFAAKALAVIPWKDAVPSAFPKKPFIVSMIEDRNGTTWIGTEEEGIWRHDPASPAADLWERYTTNSGLGDDNGYALACDRLGRIWVGHLNHGVSVFNGQAWQNYDVVGGLANPKSLSGPIGEHVFAIAVCPTDGDVWMATSAGLTRYSEKKDDWTYYTQADGLPSDQANAIAFDAAGNIYVGTQCDGIAMGDVANGYAAWRGVKGPAKLPTDPAGSGLPTSLINDVLVAADGTVYAATNHGLAWSADKGKTWQYTRGKDWAAKVKGLEGGAPAGWVETPGAYLAADYITCLAENSSGLWVGYRKEGSEVVDVKNDRIVRKGTAASYTTRILATEAQVLVGTFGDGLKTIAGSKAGATPSVGKVSGTVFPAGAQPLTDEQMARAVERLSAAAAEIAAPGGDTLYVQALPDDWRTQGAWLGRYGKYWACLCGMDSMDYRWGTAPTPMRFSASIGAHHAAGDGLFSWIQWLYTDQSRVLEMPPVYFDSRLVQGYVDSTDQDRRQGEWNDQGSGYNGNHDGPNVLCVLDKPAGAYIVSLYFVNKDGHSGTNRVRDYSVGIRQFTSDDADTEPEVGPMLAQSRIGQFWGGCYKRFIVSGPASKFQVEVDRNYSMNAILSAIMVDSADPFPAAYYGAALTMPDASLSRLDELELGFRKNGRALAASTPAYVAYARRAMAAQATAPAQGRDLVRLLNCLNRINCFPNSELLQKQADVTPAREIEKSLRWDGVGAFSGRESAVLPKPAARKPIWNGAP